MSGCQSCWQSTKGEADRTRRKLMAAWTPEEQLRFDLAWALRKVTIPGFRRAITEGSNVNPWGQWSLV